MMLENLSGQLSQKKLEETEFAIAEALSQKEYHMGRVMCEGKRLEYAFINRPTSIKGITENGKCDKCTSLGRHFSLGNPKKCLLEKELGK